MIQYVLLIVTLQAATNRQRWREKQESPSAPEFPIPREDNVSRDPSPSPSTKSWGLMTDESYRFPANFLQQLQQVQETFRLQEADQARLQTERGEELREKEERKNEISELKKYLKNKEKELKDSVKQNKKLATRNTSLLSELKSQESFNHGKNTNAMLFQIQHDQARTIRKQDTTIEELSQSVHSLQQDCFDRTVVDEHNANLLSEKSELMRQRTQLEESLSLANEEKNEVQEHFRLLHNTNVIQTLKDSERKQNFLECEMEGLTAKYHWMQSEYITSQAQLAASQTRLAAEIEKNAQTSSDHVALADERSATAPTVDPVPVVAVVSPASPPQPVDAPAASPVPAAAPAASPAPVANPAPVPTPAARPLPVVTPAVRLTPAASPAPVDHVYVQ